MADPEIGRLQNVSLGEMLPTLKEHPELCTVTAFAAIGIQVKLSYLENGLYELAVYSMTEPPELKSRDYIEVPEVTYRFQSLRIVNDVAAERMIASAADEIAEFLKEQTGE